MPAYLIANVDVKDSEKFKDYIKKIKVNKIERKEYTISEDIINLSRSVAREMNLKIFGFDLVKSLNQSRYYLIDLNDFPGFRGIPNIETELKNYLETYILTL